MLNAPHLKSLTPEEEEIVASTAPTRLLRRAMIRNLRRARNGFVVLMVFVLVALGILYRYQTDLCHETHKRYDTLRAVINTSTSVTPVARRRLPASQLAELDDYYRDLRTRLLADLGTRSDC